ncbi:MAG TPA: hypothetical protein VJ437_06680 [Acidiferrobacterales bacterium]|nr:hypothetical protein [Acidiferrobacterales bacterium]
MFAMLAAAAGVTGFSAAWGADAAAGLAGGGVGVVLQAVAATAAINNIGIVFSFVNLITYLLCVENGQLKNKHGPARPRPHRLFRYSF